MHNTKTKFCQNHSTGERNRFFVSNNMSVCFVIHVKLYSNKACIV